MSFRPLYAKHSKSLLVKTSSLKQLVNKASYLNQLQQCLNLYLSTTIRENCAIASFQNGILTILVNNAHWATRLRYQQNKLKQQLQEHHEFYGIHKVAIKVSPKPLKEPEEVHELTMSSKTAKIIAETAENINHPALREALERLSKHTR
ncbi:DUF721 domain-containing protein [Entomomonas sp. E2T0]|uniref:DUF721 domain-containing protein n=1 Tax=Entomomonas sp. E2T0 TaxID=2930213 RepID=UPI0022283B2F|nr:DUF721 domain-containing protein [Entomomonas sp. E2T0]UYZ84119.1 DUF721 domain-containing protein [Entomomonas sp. E2T0]